MAQRKHPPHSGRRRKRGGRRAVSGTAKSQAPPRRTMLAALPRAADALLHSSEPDSPPWKYLPLVLVLAFAVRAALALSGDFFLHPDEIMQYLEQAHRLVFGNGVVFWEYFYGARSWLVPGLIAGVLYLFKLLGLGAPFWYVGGVKLVFCAISLLIPAGMYFFARRHFGETSARIALLAGAFWYELVGFAHKPMTEFVATALLVVLLALCVRPAARTAMIWSVAALAVLTAATRVQYAPLALLLLGVVFLRSGKKRHLTLAVTLFFLAVGVFDAVTWGGGLFHSYLTNIRFNLNYSFGRLPYPMPAYQFLWWLLLASGGLSVLCLAAALGHLRRYGLLLALIAVLLLIHSLQTHKEYRFIFVVLPLWLLIGSDLLARLLTCTVPRVRHPRRLAAAAAIVFTAICTAGILNALPYQEQVYRTPFTKQNTVTKFIPRLHPELSSIFAAYRYLADAPGVTAVWQRSRYYASTPGYYYLHRQVPFYDYTTAQPIIKDPTTLLAHVSHIVSETPDFAIPGYSVAKTFGTIRILQRDRDEPAVRQWQEYVPHDINHDAMTILRTSGISRRVAPPNWGIQFVE